MQHHHNYTDDRLAHARAHAQGQMTAAAMNGVFWWMFVGLGVTGLVGAFLVETPLIEVFVRTPGAFFGLLIAELALVWILSANVHRLNMGVATAMFLGYAALNGVTMALVFLMYTGASVATTFVITGGMFAAMAVYGTVTKKDLSSWGSFLFMGLIGVILASIVNIFLESSMLYWGITFAGILVFVGLTAYDVQKIRALAASGYEPRRVAILGALTLYLDFINLFLLLLRLFGSRRD